MVITHQTGQPKKAIVLITLLLELREWRWATVKLYACLLTSYMMDYILCQSSAFILEVITRLSLLIMLDICTYVHTIRKCTSLECVPD